MIVTKDEGARPLYEAPQLQVVPDFNHVAAKKLKELQARGYTVTGYSIEKTSESGTVARGFITSGGFVGWWQGQHTNQQPQADALDADLLSFLQDQSLDLRCFSSSDGEDVGWRTVQHHMSEPRERVVSEVYCDQPRRAIREAMARIERDPYCTGPLHLEDDAAIAAAKVTVLPDGSAFAVYSYPLPEGHWLYAPREYEQGAEEPKELAAPILTHAAREQVISAIRYAVRGATDCGKEIDFDPDALVQNAVYALCGPFNKNQPPPQAAAQTAALLEREAFEAWWRENVSQGLAEIDHDYRYWAIWQARA